MDQPSVDPLADLEAVFAWFEVEIGGALCRRGADQGGKSLVGIGRAARVAPGFLQPRQDLPAGGDMEADLAAGKIPAGLLDGIGRRILHGEVEPPLALPVGQQAFLPGGGERQEADGGPVEGLLAQAGQRQAMVVGGESRQLPRAGQPEELQDGGEALARILAPELARAGQLLAGDRAGFEQGLSEPKGFQARHGCLATVSAERKITSSLRDFMGRSCRRLGRSRGNRPDRELSGSAGWSGRRSGRRS